VPKTPLIRGTATHDDATAPRSSRRANGQCVPATWWRQPHRTSRYGRRLSGRSPFLPPLGSETRPTKCRRPTNASAPSWSPPHRTQAPNRETATPAALPHRESCRTESPAPPVSGRLRLGPGTASRNAPENTIARFPPAPYHGYMTSRQAPKRAGYMNPAPRFSAALASGVVAW
jgi:hypothetical protein